MRRMREHSSCAPAAWEPGARAPWRAAHASIVMVDELGMSESSGAITAEATTLDSRVRARVRELGGSEPFATNVSLSRLAAGSAVSRIASCASSRESRVKLGPLVRGWHLSPRQLERNDSS